LDKFETTGEADGLNGSGIFELDTNVDIAEFEKFLKKEIGFRDTRADNILKRMENILEKSVN
jgi:hypothetical protein